MKNIIRKIITEEIAELKKYYWQRWVKDFLKIIKVHMEIPNLHHTDKEKYLNILNMIERGEEWPSSDRDRVSWQWDLWDNLADHVESYEPSNEMLGYVLDEARMAVENHFKNHFNKL